MRLDAYLFAKGHTVSRTRALNLIKLGGVKVNGEVVKKASFDVSEKDLVEVTDLIEFASLGGLKLQTALDEFLIRNLGVCVDLGSSNGGFCDVLLRRGAERVYAVDVGECALPADLVKDPRIVVMDRTNAKQVPLADGVANTVTADLSFISITLVLQEIYRLLCAKGKAILLVKPQFEVGKSGLTKSGVVKSEKLALSALQKVRLCAEAYGFLYLGHVPTPRLFEDKNVEYLLYLAKA